MEGDEDVCMQLLPTASRPNAEHISLGPRRPNAELISLRSCHLHTLACSKREHTSAYVSIRERTLAYVSIREHT